jgi:hypothetical protein
MSAFVIEMQVAVVEKRNALKGRHIRDSEPPSLKDDQARGPKLLQGPVDVDGREAGSITEIGLRDRPVAHVAISQAHDPEPLEEFADDVGKALEGAPLSKVYRPLALHRGSHKRIPPKGLSDPRMFDSQTVQSLAGDLGHSGFGESAQRVVHLPKQKNVRVAHIPGQKESHDLPPAIVQVFEAAHPAQKNNVHKAGGFALADDILVCREVANPLNAHLFKGRAILRGEPDEGLQLPHQRIRRRENGRLGVPSTWLAKNISIIGRCNGVRWSSDGPRGSS